MKQPSQVDQILADIEDALYGDDPVILNKDLRTALLMLQYRLETNPKGLPLQDIIQALDGAL